jgi:L,D-peptidoglycan transpeptidase YkuD (ErfK/YbiS/YcfS/YnhG family)
MISIIQSQGLLICVLSLLLVLGPAHASPAPVRSAAELMDLLADCSFAGLPGTSTQLLIVANGVSPASPVTVHALEKGRDRWNVPFPPIDAVIGRKGFAHPGAKREGDGKTPSGVYPLVLAFGYAKKVNTGMPYKEATEDDLWVDDPDSSDYNRWVKRGETDARSFEEMRRKDGLYRYGLVIGYNTDPVVRGYGSAIFIHVWRKHDSPTAGCVAMAEKDMVRILEWLDPSRNPLIIMGTIETVSKLAK